VGGRANVRVSTVKAKITADKNCMVGAGVGMEIFDLLG
jgi:hypothetical protein